MDEIQNSKSKLYYYVGSLLLSLAILAFVSIFTFEILYGGNEKAYVYFICTIAATSLIASFAIPYFLMKKGKEALLEYIIISSLRFVISSVMLGYAFTKLRNGHMYLSYYSLDTRLNDLDDFNTVWSFYGRFSLFQVLIGLFELVPAVLLLFRRTAFIGAVIMLPVISNVVVLNAFYHIGMMTLPLSSVLVLFNVYVLYSYKDAIKEFLKKINTKNAGVLLLKPFSRRLMGIIKVIPLFFFGALILIKILFNNKGEHKVKGAYELISFKQNNREINLDSVPVDSYKKIYFEKRRIQDGLVNKNGPQGASITFHAKDSIKISYRNGPLDAYVKEDTTAIFKGVYALPNDSELIIRGNQNRISIEAKYKKLPLKEYAYWWE